MEIVTDLPKMYTMSQVAEILEVSRSKVSRLKLDTKYPLPVRDFGRRDVVFHDDLKAWMENLPRKNREDE